MKRGRARITTTSCALSRTGTARDIVYGAIAQRGMRSFSDCSETSMT
jgi:hypothetical protein